jgi:hypothetical protein
MNRIYMRIETMNIRIFQWAPLNHLPVLPRIYMTAVDLNDGREKIFSSGVIAPLSPFGASQLWEGRARVGSCASDGVQIAEAVAASTAIPPVFSPVNLTYGRDRPESGSFVDGGVVDLSINVAKAYAALIRSDTPELSHREFDSSATTRSSSSCWTAASRSGKWGAPGRGSFPCPG